jgi:pseudouridine synthase
MEIRLNKYLAQAGIASRRKADEMIQAGQVKVNGEVVTNPAFRIIPSRHKVQVNGKDIRPVRKKIYIMLYKPRNVITTTDDEKGRKTVLDLVKVKEKIYPVGRLDRDTTGLLLLTNDGELANRIMHPRYQISKYYHVTIPGKLSPEIKKMLESGIELDGRKTAPCKIDYLKADRDGVIYGIELHQGLNRQIRRMFESVGIPVLRLKRVRLGELELKNLAPGKWRYLYKHEIQKLKKAVGLNWK